MSPYPCSRGFKAHQMLYIISIMQWGKINLLIVGWFSLNPNHLSKHNISHKINTILWLNLKFLLLYLQIPLLSRAQSRLMYLQLFRTSKVLIILFPSLSHKISQSKRISSKVKYKFRKASIQVSYLNNFTWRSQCKSVMRVKNLRGDHQIQYKKYLRESKKRSKRMH